MSHWSEACTQEIWDVFDLESAESFEKLLSTGHVLKNNRVRTVRRFPVGVLKEYRGRRSLVKARREYRNLHEAGRLGLPVPQVYWEYVHFGQPFLLMEDLGEGTTLYEVSQSRTLDLEELITLGQLCRQMIELGCYHRDFHSGNLLFKENKLFLLDLDAVDLKPGPLYLSEVIHLLASLLASLEPLKKSEHVIWIREALPQLNSERLENLFLEIDERKKQIWQAHFRSRARKALRTSGSWIREGHDVLFVRRHNLDKDEVLNLIQKEPEHHIKKDKKTSVWEDSLGGKSVIFKSFLKPQPLRSFFGFSRCRRSWLNSVQLQARGLSTPRPLALQENRAGTGVIMLENLEGALGLDQWIWESWDQLSFEECVNFHKKFSQFLRTFLNKCAWPRDFKACNVMIQGENFFLVDHDAFIFSDTIKDKDFYCGLSQLNLSIPKKISKQMRLRFLYQLFSSKEQARRAFLKIQELSRDEHILFQTAEGDREEIW